MVLKQANYCKVHYANAVIKKMCMNCGIIAIAMGTILSIMDPPMLRNITGKKQSIIGCGLNDIFVLINWLCYAKYTYVTIRTKSRYHSLLNFPIKSNFWNKNFIIQHTLATGLYKSIQ